MAASFTGWHIPLITISVVLAFVTSTHAILRRRDPRAALWWVGVAWAVPILGALFYFFFGINRIQRKAVRLGRRQLVMSPRPQRPLRSRIGDSMGISPNMRHLVALSNLVDGVVGKPLFEGNLVRPLINGDEAYPEMLRAIDAAQETISLATYIFAYDRVGTKFIEALGRAVARKVEVRVLIDGVGSGFGRASVHKGLQRAGVRVAYFLPTLVPYRMAYLNMRNHRKLMVVDGRIGFSGGMNIHEGHLLSIPHKFPTQDIQFRLDGPVVSQLQEVFREDWEFVTGEVLPGQKWFPKIEPCGPVAARGIAGGPDEDFEKLRWTIHGALAKAKDSVRIVTPYFLPDASLITALNVAAMSGVKVDIVLPQVNDLDAVQWAATAMLWQVLERGCRVWMSPPPFDHSKLLLVDGGWALFGSSNWDPRSLRLNFEFDVECYDETLVRGLEAWVDQRISKSREVTLADVDSRPIAVKLRDGIARLFMPHL